LGGSDDRDAVHETRNDLSENRAENIGHLNRDRKGHSTSDVRLEEVVSGASECLADWRDDVEGLNRIGSVAGLELDEVGIGALEHELDVSHHRARNRNPRNGPRTVSLVSQVEVARVGTGGALVSDVGGEGPQDRVRSRTCSGAGHRRAQSARDRARILSRVDRHSYRLNGVANLGVVNPRRERVESALTC